MADTHAAPSQSTSAAEVIDLGSESDAASDVSQASANSPTSSVGSSLNGSSGDLKVDIEECLDGIQSVGTFASFDSLDTIVDPQICIEDGKDTIPIDLPLSEDHAQAIIRTSHQAPFGKGSETIVDTTVRKTWELSPSQFRIRNPEWQQHIRGIVAKVADELGISAGAETVHGDLYKMLLYEKGGLFKAHTDTEKVRGMFGTLMICLPSKHEGGAVVVRHGKQVKTFRSENFEQCYIFWYSDVKHQVTKVMSGYRWVLTYNLVRTDYDTQPRSTTDVYRDLRFLRAVLKNWRKELEDGKSPHEEMIYLLEHQYTEDTLRFSCLKGRDLVKAQVLRDVCDQTDFCFYLASLERKVSGQPADYYYGYSSCYGTSHEIVDVDEESLALKRVVDLDGELISENISIEESDIIPEEAFEEREPDDEDYEGYTGNEGAYTTQWYRDTALVLMPREHYISFLLRPFQYGPKSGGLFQDSYLQLEILMEGLIDQLTRDPQNKRLRDDLLRACEFVTNLNINLHKTNERIEYLQRVEDRWDLSTKTRFPDKIVRLVVKASCLLKSRDLFEKATLSVKKQLPPSSFSDVGTLPRTFGFSTLHEVLIKAINPISTIHERFRAIQRILESDSPEHTEDNPDPSFLTWALEQLKEVMVNPKRVSKEDGVALADLMTWEHTGKPLFEAAVTMAKQHAQNTPFIVSLLVAMSREDEANKRVWRDILSEMLQVFTLCHEPEPDQEPEANKFATIEYGPGGSMAFLPPIYGASRSGKDRKAPIEPSVLAKLLLDCLKQDLQTEANIMLEKTMSDADRVDVRDFHTMLLPFLKEVVPVLQAQQIPLTEPRFQSLYQSIINSYIKRYVGMQPARPSNWIRPRVKCICSDCFSLDRFLTNPTERVGRFAMVEKRRKHLEYELDRLEYICSTERTGRPYTLVVTKTNRAYERDLQAWKGRVEETRQKILALGDENLRGLLGDRYEELTQLSAVKLPEAQTTAPLAPETPPSSFATGVFRPQSSRRPGLPSTASARYGQSSHQLSRPTAQNPYNTHATSETTTAQPFAPNSGNKRPSMEDVSKRVTQQANPTRAGNNHGTKRKADEIIDLTGDD